MSILVDLNKKELVYSGSAHPAALMWSHKDRSFEKLNSQNPIIGFEKSTAQSYVEEKLPLVPKNKIILYTDGIIEAENQQQKSIGTEGIF